MNKVAPAGGMLPFESKGTGGGKGQREQEGNKKRHAGESCVRLSSREETVNIRSDFSLEEDERPNKKSTVL